MEVRELLAFEPGSQEQFVSLWLGYTDSLGHPALRQTITEVYEHIAENQVLVHSGAEEAIFNFMQVAVNAGDHVIVHAPYYQSLGEVARNIGAEVTEWRGHPERGWALDLDDLESELTDRTKVVVVNFPHNPTGFLPTSKFVQELSALSERHGFILFSDEVYRGLEFDSTDRLPAIADINERAVSLGVMSKAYGLAGLRIGWIATRNDRLFGKLAAFKDYTTICNSAPSEFLATLALRHGVKIIERNLQIIRDNLNRLNLFFSAHGELFKWHSPKAGSIAFPMLLQGKVDKFCADLVEKAGVLLLPGTLYGDEYNAFRIGFGRKNLPESLERFEQYLRKAG
ncbi:MAG: aminotransferase class I/II-fold pyridoxal phosphate-dependent enzyme [Candidatus Competibacteraceae bacterium]|nr:aminotransferase class I/II-fold pyridoxal phosphate-dependent enzyme [Candidatus Competibacteraceae bacterium]